MNPVFVFAGSCSWTSQMLTDGNVLTRTHGSGGNSEKLYLGCKEKGKGKFCDYGDIVVLNGELKQCAKVSEQIAGKSVQYTAWQDHPVTKLTTCSEKNYESLMKKYERVKGYDIRSIGDAIVVLRKIVGKDEAVNPVCFYTDKEYKKVLSTGSDACKKSGGTPEISEEGVFKCICPEGFLPNRPLCIKDTENDCVNAVGKRECKDGEHKGSYFVCKTDSDCTTGAGTLPANATAGHCWAGRTDYSVCTATACDAEKGYTLTQGYCKYDPNAKAENVEEPPVVESTEGDASKICSDSGGTPNANGDCDCDEKNGLEPTEENPKKCKCNRAGYEFDKNQEQCVATESAQPVPALTATPLTGTEEQAVEHIPTQIENPYEGEQEEKKEQLAEKLKSAQAALDKAKEKENSWANRGLTAASTAAAGLGAMQLAEGIAEQRADSEAETDMRAYLATMKCNYGGGKNIAAGNEEIFLPGGNELLELYAEYKTLADNLKITKAALGLRPGIESEVLYDRAESGLYKNVSVGKTGGAYTSLSRAMTDSESEDAAAWAEQKQTASKKLKAGAITAGVGVVGGAVGNYLINGRDKDDTETDATSDKITKVAEEVKKK